MQVANFCQHCGSALRPTSKFCAACGKLLGPDSANDAHDVERRRRILLAGGGGAAILMIVATFGYMAGWFGSGQASEIVMAQASDGSTKGALSADWFAAYSDRFLSGPVTLFVSGKAQKRNYPTSRGSQVIETLEPGSQVEGRWVSGADPTTRWLRTDNGAYIWEGNLADPDIITPSGMLGMVAGMKQRQLASRISANGNYGSQDASWNAEECEIYPSLDKRIEVMVLNGRAGSFLTNNSSLRTSKGIKVGSSESQLRAAYGTSLRSEENPYEGVDYFYWHKPDQGIKFSVSNAVVRTITSGDRSIQYVEGCL